MLNRPVRSIRTFKAAGGCGKQGKRSGHNKAREETRENHNKEVARVCFWGGCMHGNAGKGLEDQSEMEGTEGINGETYPPFKAGSPVLVPQAEGTTQNMHRAQPDHVQDRWMAGSHASPDVANIRVLGLLPPTISAKKPTHQTGGSTRPLPPVGLSGAHTLPPPPAA